MKIVSLLAAATVAVAAPTASAQSLDGKTISLSIIEDGTSYGTSSTVAGSGVEGSYFGNQFFRVDGNTFTIRSNAVFCGISCVGNPITYEISGLDFGTPITSVNFTSSLTGVVSSLNGTTASFSFTDQPLPAGTYLTASFMTGGGVPEPATWALMILGFGAVGGAMRRRQSVTAKVRFA